MNTNFDRGELLFEEGYRLLQSEPKDSLTTSLKFVKPLDKSAKLKNGKALFIIGFILSTGYKDVSVDLKKGNKYLKKAYPFLEKLSIENHDALATRFLAKYYDIPLCHYVKDDEKVKTFLKLADSYEDIEINETKVKIDKELYSSLNNDEMNEGESTSYDYLVNLISQLDDQKDKYENLETINGIRKDADSGNIRACIFLGNAYFKGEYVDKDLPLSTLYYEKAETLGSIKAKYLLGYNILVGSLSSSKSISRGLNKIYQAAKAGLPEALYFLGKVYFDGIYVKEDLDKAYYYFQSAASRGYSEALEAIKKVDLKKNDVFALKMHLK